MGNRGRPGDELVACSRHVIWVAGWALLLIPAAARSENLEEAWSVALAVSQRLRASGELTASAAETLASARAARLPSMTNAEAYTALTDQLSYKANLGFLAFGIPITQQNFFSSGNFVTQPLCTSGRIRNTIAAAEAGVHAAQSDEARVALDLKMSVAEAYVEVLYAQRLAVVADRNVAGLENHVRIVNDLIKQKQRVRGDLLAAEVQLADGRQQALQAHNQLEVARASYNRYLGRPLCDPVELEEPDLPPSGEDLCSLTTQAMASRPELAGLRYQQEGLCRQADAVRAETRPQVALQGGFVYFQNRYLTPDTYGIASLALRWDLDAGVTKHRANALARRACATAAERAELESAIELQVRQAYLDEQTARARVDTTRQAVDQADENVKATVNRYRNAAATNAEVLDAMLLRLRASANYYNAVYNAVLAQLRLRRAVGCL